jgi:hypothetical protein
LSIPQVESNEENQEMAQEQNSLKTKIIVIALKNHQNNLITKLENSSQPVNYSEKYQQTLQKIVKIKILIEKKLILISNLKQKLKSSPSPTLQTQLTQATTTLHTLQSQNTKH